MTSREEFEQWADKNNLIIDKDSDGFYTFDAATVAWWAWQASREQADEEIERLQARVKELEVKSTRCHDELGHVMNETPVFTLTATYDTRPKGGKY